MTCAANAFAMATRWAPLADDSFMQNWGDSSFFLMVSNGKEQEAGRQSGKRVTSVILLLLMIVGATVGELPAVRAAFPDMKLDMFFFVSIVTIIDGVAEPFSGA